MEKNWQHIFSLTDCPSMDDLEKYAFGAASEIEKKRIEQHLSACEICSDVVDGYLSIGDPTKIPAAESALSDRLDQAFFKPKKKTLQWITVRKLSIAASILLLVGLAWYFLILNEKPAVRLAQNTLHLPEESSESSDTLVIARQETKVLHTATARPVKNVPSGIEIKEIKKLPPENRSLAVVEPENAAGKGNKAFSALSSAQPLSGKDESLKNALWQKPFVFSGKVTDSITGEGIHGVNVVLKGTTKGVTTDSDGRFQLTTTENQALFSFSTIGYKPEEKKISPNHDTDIALVQDLKMLNEVVVAGYGTKQKKEMVQGISILRKDKMASDEVASQPRFDPSGVSPAKIPEQPSTWLELAKNYLNQKNQGLTLETLEKAKKLSDKKTQKQLTEIIKLVEDKNYSRATELLSKIKKH